MSTNAPDAHDPFGLTPRQLRANRLGLALFLISESIPIIVLINVRYVLAGAYVSPDVSPYLGGIAPTALLAASALIALQALRAAAGRKPPDTARLLSAAIGVGLLGLLTQVWPLFQRPVNPMTHYGEIYLTTVGTGGFFTFVTLLMLFGAALRAKRLGLSDREYWGIESSVWFWTFNAAAWLALYVSLYVL